MMKKKLEALLKNQLKRTVTSLWDPHEIYIETKAEEEPDENDTVVTVQKPDEIETNVEQPDKTVETH